MKKNRINYPACRRLQNRLASTFPGAFKSGGPKHPLVRKIDVELRVACPDISDQEIRDFLEFYTGKPSYLRGVIAPGSHRVNLEGLSVEPVHEAHRKHAARRLEAIAARKQATLEDRQERANV